MREKFANHLRTYFSDSAFIRNKDNVNYVAKSYIMAQKMCENTGFLDITDIYACIVNLVEHSYGYDSTEILLTDTQVVHLMAGLDEGDYDTDYNNLLDRQELDHEENVNISNLLEEYIKYNRLPEEETNKLRADPYIKMWAYKSNLALPNTDFDGRNDDFDIHRPLENRQSGKMSTLNYDEVNFDYSQDYRYFFMPSTQYYYELSEMSMVLANMVNKKSGVGRTQNVMRNVIAISIGDIEAKAAELYANFDGHSGREGDYTEYHHVGFDIVANRILETLERYASRYTPECKKVF